MRVNVLRSFILTLSLTLFGLLGGNLVNVAQSGTNYLMPNENLYLQCGCSSSDSNGTSDNSLSNSKGWQYSATHSAWTTKSKVTFNVSLNCQSNYSGAEVSSANLISVRVKYPVVSKTGCELSCTGSSDNKSSSCQIEVNRPRSGFDTTGDIVTVQGSCLCEPSAGTSNSVFRASRPNITY